MSMYSEIILDYYRTPRCKGSVEGHNVKARDTNPSCGDIIEIQAFVDGDVIKDIKYDGKGCAISQAAAGMLCEYLKGKKIEIVKDLEKEEVLQMLGIPISGMRLKCALLSMKVVKYGVYEYLGKEPEVKEEIEQTDTESKIRESLKRVIDPELQMDIVTLGLLRDIKIEGNKVTVVMTLTSPMCPFGPTIMEMVKAGAKIEGIDEVKVDLSFEPPWEPPEEIRMMLGV